MVKSNKSLNTSNILIRFASTVGIFDNSKIKVDSFDFSVDNI